MSDIPIRLRSMRSGPVPSRLQCAILSVALVGLGWLPPLSVARAANPVFVETSKLKLEDDHSPPIDLRHRRIDFRSSTTRSAPENRVIPPTRGSSDDPSLVGGVIAIANTAGV